MELHSGMKNIDIFKTTGGISTATICRVGKDIWRDIGLQLPKDIVEKYKKIWTNEGFRVHTSNRDYHSDGAFCVVKPGCIVSLNDKTDEEDEKDMETSDLQSDNSSEKTKESEVEKEKTEE